jgi:hypothetical protein
MTDRELLELAALAAGFGGPQNKTCWTESEYPRGSGNTGALWNYVGYMDAAELWNPLTDDGDALRLAVNLKIPMQFPDWEDVTRTWATQDDPDAYDEIHGNDPYAATRRAIVRAAAEIGESMKKPPL